MSRKRSQNKKAWARQRHRADRSRGFESGSAQADPARGATPSVLRHVKPPPSEMDQISVLIVEEQLGLPVTDLDGMKEIAARLPFEPCMSLLAILAGRVEATLRDGRGQIDLAREFFGDGPLVQRYAQIIAGDDRWRIFGPQSLYTLMRVLIDDAYDAPITQQLTDEERGQLFRAVVASNSVIESGTGRAVGPTQEDLLAYELQIGTYYSRPQWMEEISRHWDLYELMTADEDLAESNDVMPVAEWIERSGLTAVEQWELGWGLSAGTNAWDAANHPHVAPASLADMLERGGFAGREKPALALISADRTQFREAFAQLAADGGRYMWELRPFKTWPFLRLQDDGGMLLLGQPWIVSWLTEGFYYRPLLVAQSEDAADGGRTDHVQRYTSFAGQAFEAYCLRLAHDYVPGPAIVLGEHAYGKGGGSRTSDVAILTTGGDLILFEANARRVAAEPLVSGDPQSATDELTKLLVKKVNQLGVTLTALLVGDAVLPGIDLAKVKRIFPVVVGSGRLWYTRKLWEYIEASRDPEKCASFADGRVQPLQVAESIAYEALIGLAHDGHDLGEVLAHKTDGPWVHRDWGVWLREDPRAPDQPTRLPSIDATFNQRTNAAMAKWFPTGPLAGEARDGAANT